MHIQCETVNLALQVAIIIHMFTSKCVHINALSIFYIRITLFSISMQGCQTERSLTSSIWSSIVYPKYNFNLYTYTLRLIQQYFKWTQKCKVELFAEELIWLYKDSCLLFHRFIYFQKIKIQYLTTNNTRHCRIQPHLRGLLHNIKVVKYKIIGQNIENSTKCHYQITIIIHSFKMKIPTLFSKY